MAATLATIPEDARRVRVERRQARPGRGVRPLAVWHFPGRPARSALVSELDNEQAKLGLTREAYADLFKVSLRNYARFRAGGKLPKQLRQGLLQRRPKWKRLVDKVVEEDVRFDDLLAGLR